MNANLENIKKQEPSKIGLANIITFCRVLLALTVFGLLLGFPSDKEFLQLSFFLTLLVIIGDMLDGFVARKFEESSKFGAWFDIAADRLVEICYWVVFASLGWISAWIAIIFVCRGVLVDGIRSFALAEGYSAFGSETMMKSGVSRFLVASNFSRTTYAIVKAAAFGIVILAQVYTSLLPTALTCVYLATIFCLLRGLPVLIDGKRFLIKE